MLTFFDADGTVAVLDLDGNAICLEADGALAALEPCEEIATIFVGGVSVTLLDAEPMATDLEPGAAMVTLWSSSLGCRSAGPTWTSPLEFGLCAVGEPLASEITFTLPVLVAF